ncbi:MAG: UDP-N-acetylmuramoyl-L-alanine--D-glutamate ligase [Bacteroidales bacterium]|nr:UDP-N-acetylmuramoyl-L-alanine--D-glutamate ligase [Bacteroidales bacterium]
MSKIVILGGGESGAGAAVLAHKQGHSVFLSDTGRLRDKHREWLTGNGIKFEEGGPHTMDLLLMADEVVKSPGIPDNAPAVQALRERNIPIISEIEFAGRYNRAKTVCITGSNGKTTTTSLIYHMMQKAGLNVGLAGNIGDSFAYQVANCNYDYYVLELSSFQLDGIYEFKPDIAILLNITPDHLDRYDYRMQNYVNSKFRITRNLRADDCFIFCSDDEVTVAQLKQIVLRAQQLPFSQRTSEGQMGWLAPDTHTIVLDYMRQTLEIPVEQLSLKGKHNIYNSMAAGLAGQVLNIRKEVIREALSDFSGVEHRLEFVERINNVVYINDSKATNVNSAWYALESMNTPVVWIVGGTDKGNDYSELLELVHQKVKAIVCLGIDNSKIRAAFSPLGLPIFETQSAREAVAQSQALAAPGDTVLLSPCCASFDLFKNYEDRGRQFKTAVKELPR